jgi:hypothetical protein
MKTPRFTAIALYLGFGAICLAVFEGTAINWSSAWTYGWLLAWPLGLLLIALKWFIVFGLIVFVGVVAIMVWERWLS